MTVIIGITIELGNTVKCPVIVIPEQKDRTASKYASLYIRHDIYTICNTDMQEYVHIIDIFHH